MRPLFKILIFLALLFSPLSLSEFKTNFCFSEKKFGFFQKNTVFTISSPKFYEKNSKVLAIITAYSSTFDQTDDSPLITASGEKVKEGIVANNFFPFGTKIKIPEIFGEKIFVVEDRMKEGRSKYHFDIWFENLFEAKNFGSKIAEVEIFK